MKKAITPFILFIVITLWATSCSKPTESCFSYSKSKITTDSIVTFNASCSGNASYFTWNFGDSTNDTTTTALTMQHRFLKVGNYIVTLTAKRKDGVTMGKDTKASQMITVE